MGISLSLCWQSVFVLAPVASQGPKRAQLHILLFQFYVDV